MAEAKPQEIATQCILHDSRLKSIERAVNESNVNIKNLAEQLVSAEGYIPRIHERLSLVESSAERAHERLDTHSANIDKVEGSHNALAIKVAGVVASLVVLFDYLVGKLL